MALTWKSRDVTPNGSRWAHQQAVATTSSRSAETVHGRYRVEAGATGWFATFIPRGGKAKYLLGDGTVYLWHLPGLEAVFVGAQGRASAYRAAELHHQRMGG